MAPFLTLARNHRHLFRLWRHYAAEATVIPQKLLLTAFGDPEKVISLEEDSPSALEAPKGDEVLLKVLASPINPADINTAQGIYPVKPSLPGVIGHEGVMEVLEVGPAVTELKRGDHVLAADSGFGLWRTHLRLRQEDVLPVDKRLSIPAAATLTVNPCTAFRLLKDFARLRPGDWVLQNGATSGVGLFVSQLCRAWGLNSCGIIRDRATPDATAATKATLTAEFGATLVLTETEVRDRQLTKQLSADGGAKVAFNCVGGKQTMSLLKLLHPGASLVTYGAMAMAPMAVPAGPLIFNDVALRGFWMTAWSRRERRSPSRLAMLSELSELLISGQVRPAPTGAVPLADFRKALAASKFGGANDGALRLKQLLVMP